jgi:hypothetical protein
MKKKNLIRNVSQIYLSLVPVFVAVTGFTIGHISYKIYLPIWIINACLMIIATWILGAHVARNQDVEKKHLVVISSFLIIPWILFSIFFGMGPPPDTPAGWVNTAAEQQIRYCILIFGGVIIAFGFGILREKLINTPGYLYSVIGFISLMIAIPLFIVNMTFWGGYLVELFRIIVASSSEKKPDWFVPVRGQFEMIRMVEVALIYLAAASFAASLKSAGWLRKTPSRIYIIISCVCLFIALLPVSEPFTIAVYAVSIPAVPFFIPYLIGINLMRRAGD